MIRFLSLAEALQLHLRVAPGSGGLRDLGALESALAQPRMTFGGDDLYPELVYKAVVLALAAGDGGRDLLLEWLRAHLVAVRRD